MKNLSLQHILEEVAKGKLKVDDALKKAHESTFFSDKSQVDSCCQPLVSSVQDTLSGLTLDTERKSRTGLSEVVFAPHKNDTQLISAITHLHEFSPVLVTRLSSEQQKLLRSNFPQGSHLESAGLFTLGKTLPDENMSHKWAQEGEIIVISAGGADRKVALEAFGALHFWNIAAGFIADVGVAGLHRLSPHVSALQKAKIIIAVAGMEGALPGIVAGFVRCPVLAVPTSVGYGVGEKGITALNSMLCSCVPGLAVCNIDNGFGAAAFAAKMILNHSEHG